MTKNFFSRTFIRSLAVMACLITGLAHAQLRVEIAGVGANQIPIAIAAFGNESIAPQQVSAIIKADLTRSGYFKVMDTGVVLTENSPVDLADWKSRGADAVVVGSVQRLPDGRFDVRYRLFDTVKAAQLSSLALAAQPQYIRVSAHKIADDIYEKLTGIPGAFATRIAYVTKVGKEYHLEVADSDGQGTQVALRSNEPIISPAWSPDGTKVAYVSFENKKPVVYVQDLVTRKRSVAANYKGSNSAPSWSPDGSKLAVALSRDGMTQVYVVNIDGTGLRRLSNIERHRYRTAILRRRPEHLFHQRSQRRPANLQDERRPAAKPARHVQRQLQHQPAHFVRMASRWPIFRAATANSSCIFRI